MVMFFVQMLSRVKSKSPKFFVKIRRVMIVLGCFLLGIDICTDAVAINSLWTNVGDPMPAFHIIHLSAKLQATFNSHIVSIMSIITTATGFTFFTTDDPALLDTKTKQAIVDEAHGIVEAKGTAPATPPEKS